jgi:hypothetical protein
MKSMGGPQITIAKKTGAAALAKRVLGITRLAAYVGVPASSTKQRSEQLLGMAGKTSNKKKKAFLLKSAKEDVTNAELLFIHTKGSPARHIPARPVLEPAIEAQGNKEPIARELAASVKAALDGDAAGRLKYMRRAAMAGQNAARSWFTDSRNGWAPLAESTIQGRLRRMSPGLRKKAEAAVAAGKGGDVFKPLIDTGALRASIQGVVAEE